MSWWVWVLVALVSWVLGGAALFYLWFTWKLQRMRQERETNIRVYGL